MSCHLLEDLAGVIENTSCVMQDCKKNGNCSNCQSVSDRPENYCESPKDKVPFKCHELVYNRKKPFCDIGLILNLKESIKILSNRRGQSQMTKRDYASIEKDLDQLLIQIESGRCQINNSLAKAFLDIKLFEYIISNKSNLLKHPLLEKSKSKYNFLKSNSSIKKCNCAEDLYLYNNPVIEMEGEIVQASLGGDMEGEGALNYIIEPDEDFPMNFGRDYRFSYTELTSSSTDNGLPIIAFLDSGMDPDLFDSRQYIGASNACGFQNDTRGWNFSDEDNTTHDDLGHGTLVAASFKNILDTKSPHTNYKILPVKVLDDCGYGTIYTTVCGLHYASTKGADIINCSWGIYKDVNVLKSAIREISQNSFIVTSAGNKAYDLTDEDHYPSEYSRLNLNYGFRNVFEVAGICLPYTSTNASIYEFWNNSNRNKKNIAESAVGYEGLVGDLVDLFGDQASGLIMQDCEVNGTSYAAPRITAALAKEWNNNVNNTYSIFMDKLNNLNNCQQNQSYWSGQ